MGGSQHHNFVVVLGRHRPEFIPPFVRGSSNGRTPPFGGGYNGSNPFPRAKGGRGGYLGSPAPKKLSYVGGIPLRGRIPAYGRQASPGAVRMIRLLCRLIFCEKIITKFTDCHGGDSPVRAVVRYEQLVPSS